MDAALAQRRAIIHVDLDCFYAQVETVRLGLDPATPLAVQQWQLLAAVNYPARAQGIGKMSTVQEAKSKCPDIVLVHVASWAKDDTTPQYHANPAPQTHKISLDVYRAASKRVMRVLARYSPSFQRASIDEAFLDVTEEVNQVIRRLAMEEKLRIEEGSGLPVVEWVDAGTLAGVSARPETEDRSAVTMGWGDLQLRIAADISKRIRAAVFAELQYTCSAGIAHNKTLAKLCSGLHKPNNQTVLLQDHVMSFLEPYPFNKIRNLGGKLGGEIEDHFPGFSKCGQLWSVPLEEWKSKLGDQTGTWVFDIIRGICGEPVKETQLHKSLGAVKSLRPPVNSCEAGIQWIEVLASEIFLRLQEEVDEFGRWPKTFSVSFRSEYKPTVSKSCPMPGRLRITSPDSLVKLALSVLSMGASSAGSSPTALFAPLLPCSNLSIICSGLADEGPKMKSVTSFFAKADPSASSRLMEKPHLNVEECDDMEERNVSVAEEKGNSTAEIDTHRTFTERTPEYIDKEDVGHLVRCPLCNVLVEPDDQSMLEHDDYHVAVSVHQDGMRQTLKVDRGMGDGKRKQESSAGNGKTPKRKKTPLAPSSAITSYFKRV